MTIHISSLLDQCDQIDSAKFKSLVKNIHELIQIAKDFPAYNIRLIERILGDSDELKRLVSNNIEFQIAERFFPNHASQLVERVLSNSDAFQNIVTNHNEFIVIVERYPVLASKCFERILSNSNDFKRIVKKINDIEFISSGFPFYNGQLIQHVLSDSNEFMRLILGGGSSFLHAILNYPAYATRIIERLFSYPDNINRMADSLIELFLFTDDWRWRNNDNTKTDLGFFLISCIAQQIIQDQTNEMTLGCHFVYILRNYLRRFARQLADEKRKNHIDEAIDLAGLLVRVIYNDAYSIQKKKDRIALEFFNHYYESVKYYNSKTNHKYNMSLLPKTQVECIEKALSFFRYISPDYANYRHAEDLVTLATNDRDAQRFIQSLIPDNLTAQNAHIFLEKLDALHTPHALLWRGRILQRNLAPVIMDIIEDELNDIDSCNNAEDRFANQLIQAMEYFYKAAQGDNRGCSTLAQQYLAEIGLQNCRPRAKLASLHLHQRTSVENYFLEFTTRLGGITPQEIFQSGFSFRKDNQPHLFVTSLATRLPSDNVNPENDDELGFDQASSRRVAIGSN